MKAGVLCANEDLRVMEFPCPEIGEQELLVKVRMTGICGSDVPRVLYNGARFYPIVLGHEFSGEVVQTGSAVTGFSVGDRVAGAPLLPCMQCEDCQKGNFSLCKHYSFIGSRVQGAFAEYVALPAANAVKFDSTVSFEQGAFLSRPPLHSMGFAVQTLWAAGMWLFWAAAPSGFSPCSGQRS